MLKMLVDTCVWLDMAKTPSQSKNLEILSTLRAEGELDVIVPQVVLDEFLRNRDRVIGEYVKSIATTLSRAKEIVIQQGGKRRTKTLDKLFDQANSQIRTPKDVAEEQPNRGTPASGGHCRDNRCNETPCFEACDPAQGAFSPR
jgi:PIN domain